VIRRAWVFAIVLLMLVHAEAGAEPIRGRSPGAEAEMAAVTARTLADAGEPVQVFTSLCRRPREMRRCEPMSSRFQRALGDALGVRVRWVEEPPVGGPDLVVFAPVELGVDRAVATASWRELSPHGCFGEAQTTFERRRGAWVAFVSAAWVGCPA
jgi:hypothetical protein